MNLDMLHFSDLSALAFYAIIVFLFCTAVIAISYILGEKHNGRSTSEPYESGIRPTGTARTHFDVKYYLIAMVFVIFDLESIFIFAWAVSARETGWTGYLAIAVFIVILLVALFYLWKTGVLDWVYPVKSPETEHES